MKFLDEPVKVVYRHWICGNPGCEGEMLPVGIQDGINWQHQCQVCMREELADKRYPRSVNLVVEQSEETREI